MSEPSVSRTVCRGIPRTGTAGAVCGVALAIALMGCTIAAMSPPGVLSVLGILGLVGIGVLLGWMARGDWEQR